MVVHRTLLISIGSRKGSTHTRISIRHGVVDTGSACDSNDPGQRARPLTVFGGTWENLGSTVSSGCLPCNSWPDSDIGSSGYGASSTRRSAIGDDRRSTGGNTSHGHFVDGVSLRRARLGLMCGTTSVFVRNVTIGAQYDSGLDLHSSFDRSICKRAIRGTLLRSPHNRVVQV
jgi:hypothetical protein